MCVRACMGLFGSFPSFLFFGASRGGGGGETLGKISEQAGQGKEGKRGEKKEKNRVVVVEDQKYFFFGRDDGKSRQGRARLFGCILPFSLLGICIWSFSRRGEPSPTRRCEHRSWWRKKSLGIPPPRSM